MTLYEPGTGDSAWWTTEYLWDEAQQHILGVNIAISPALYEQPPEVRKAIVMHLQDVVRDVMGTLHPKE